MKKYKCLIADDSLMELDIMEMLVGKIAQLEIVAVCDNGLKAQQILATHDIDLVFSDINMPELSGISLLKSLKKAPVFIFVSGHTEYAVESYDLNVIDYIVKPVTLERILKSANKAIEYLNLKNMSETKQLPSQQHDNDYFFIRESNDLIKLHLEDVAYIESMGDFSKIYTVNDKKHITLVSLKNLEVQLPASSFTRIHKQFIVNHNLISAISTDELIVNGKYTLPLSQSLKAGLLEKVVNKKILTRHLSKDS